MVIREPCGAKQGRVVEMTKRKDLLSDSLSQMNQAEEVSMSLS